VHREHGTADDHSGRRFLIATAVAHHKLAPEWDRPRLVDARKQIVDLFTTTLDYQHVSDLGLDPTKDQLTSHLRSFCRSAQPDDLLAVYIAGHGEVLANGEHVLLTTDTDPGDIDDALPVTELARKMLLGTNIRRVLLMLDTCYAGRGGNDLTAAALTRMIEPWQNSHDTGLVVLTSAQPAQQAQTGAFPHLLRAAVDNLATAGYAPAVLALDAVVTAMNTHADKPPFQTITSTLAQLTGQVPPFLPNPRHDVRLTEVDLAIQQASEWDLQDQRRDIEFRTRLLVRAMGGHDTSRGWWFAGRHTALLDITSWLGHPDPARPVLAVTAAPGSGKTAVLGLIATLTHRERRVTVPLHTLRLPDAAIPDLDTVDVVIYAQNLTGVQVFQGICAALRTQATTVGELLEQLSGHDRIVTVLVDALDEAADPDQVIRQVLGPLGKHARGRLRLLVGTRPHLLDLLGVRREDSIDLDAPRYADLDALTTYAARGLLEAETNSPYRNQPPPLIHAVASAVAHASDPSFLVTRITSATLAAQHAVPDPADPVWLGGLPRLPGPAMRRDLDTRLGERAGMVRDLLRPLAYAEGQGLPWEDIWAPLASQMSGVTYTDDDLLWMRRHAGSYVVEALEDGRSAYRLYHQALAEHLREDVDEEGVHRAFVQFLRSRVPVGWDGVRDWTRAHPYTVRHLATHAAHAGVLDELITDLDYVVCASPDELLPALHSATTDEGRLTCAMYRASLPVHRRLPPARRRQVLAVDAARFGADHQHRALAQTLTLRPRWATGQQASVALRATLDGHDGQVTAVAHTSINGQPVVVTAGVDSTVRVWDLNTGSLRNTFTGHDSWVNAVTCTTVNDHPVAVTGGQDRTMRIWDLAIGSPGATFTGHDLPITAVACTVTDGHPIAVTGAEDQTVRVWDLLTGDLRAVLTGHEGSVRAVACTMIGDRPVAVTGGADSTVRVWDLTTASLHTTLTGHDNSVDAVACTTIDGRPIAVTGAADRTVRVWDLLTGDLRAVLTGHEGSVRAVACTMIGDRPVAVTGGADSTVRVWDLTTASLRTTLTGHDNWVNAATCAAIDGQPVAVTGSNDKSVRVWKLVDLLSREISAGHTSDINAAACTVIDGQPVAVTAGGDRTVRLWDLATGAPRAILTGHDLRVTAVACTTIDGRPVAITGSVDNTVRVWDLSTASLRTAITGHDRWIDSLACVMIDGQPIAVTGSSDTGTVRVWDLTTGILRTALSGHDLPVTAIACMNVKDQPIAVTCSTDHTVRVWDLTTGTTRAILTGHDNSVNAVACTMIDDHPVAVTGGADNTVRVWDLTAGTLRATLTGHGNRVNAVACTVIDGQPIAVTSSNDDTLRMWNLTGNNELAVFDYAGLHAGALCIGPGQEIIVGIGWDLAVIDWYRNI
jgi:WD40 repeat protein